MAGDWIPMRLDLYEDPAVIQIAGKLNVREEVVVGYLHKIWCWASRQCHNGTVTGVTLASLGRVTNVPGFPELMRDAGWLSEGCDRDGLPFVTFPKWDNWLSESAKKRLDDARRQRKSRKNRSHNTVTGLSQKKCDKSVTTGQESTGQESREKKTHSHVPENSNLNLPFKANTQRNREQLEKWQQARKELHGSRMPVVSWEAEAMTYADWSEEKWNAALIFSTRKASLSILDPDNDFSKRKPNGKPAKDYTIPQIPVTDGSDRVKA